MENSSTDHVPIMVSIPCNLKKEAKKLKKTISKRSMKNFNANCWNEALERADWSRMYKSKNIHEKAVIFSEIMNEALDTIAPVKECTTFKFLCLVF